jgi:hypothetical protein
MEHAVVGGDHGGVGQTAPFGRRSVARGAVVGIAAVSCAALLGGCGSSPANTQTKLVAARDAHVVSPTGVRQAVHLGEVIPRGYTVTTDATGSAILATGDRTLYLGGEGNYLVGTGISAQLRRGAAVVDARHGPELRLDVGGVGVRLDGAAARIERGYSVRVGVFTGAADVAVLPMTRHLLAVHALHQVIVASRELPAQTTPLVLTDDDAEQRVAPDLVQSDLELSRLATALDDGRAGHRLVDVAVSAGLPVPVTAASAGDSASPVAETALPLAMARAAVGTASTVGALTDEFKQARALRAAGGSWGVVAALLGTDAAATGRAIDVLLGPTAAVGPGGSTPVSGVTVGTPGAQPSSGASHPSGPGSPAPHPTTSPAPHPTPSHSPSAEPGPVKSLVGSVLDMLSPTPKPGGHTPAKPNPRPSCLLLHLICH